MPFIIWGPAGVSECVYIIYTHINIVWCYDRTFYLKSWMCACVLARRWLVCRPKMAGSDCVFFFFLRWRGKKFDTIRMARNELLERFMYWGALTKWRLPQRFCSQTMNGSNDRFWPFTWFDTKTTARSISMCFGTLIVFNFKCMNISGLARTKRSLSEKIQGAAFSLGRYSEPTNLLFI